MVNQPPPAAGQAPELLVQRDGAVLTLTLNRPEVRNALSPTLREQLMQAVSDVQADAAVRVVVVRGAGGHFCAGGDVKAMAEGDSPTPEARLARMRAWHPLIGALHALDRPVIAAVDGVAYGAGFGLALLADLMVLSTSARLCMAFARVGLVPDFGASYTLPRVAGMARARELILSARELGAHEAVSMGIALEAVSPARLDARVGQIARALAQASPVASGLSKRLLQASLGAPLSQMLEMESSAQAIAATSSHARAAFEAFARREPPVFAWPRLDDGDPSGEAS